MSLRLALKRSLEETHFVESPKSKPKIDPERAAQLNHMEFERLLRQVNIHISNGNTSGAVEAVKAMESVDMTILDVFIC